MTFTILLYLVVGGVGAWAWMLLEFSKKNPRQLFEMAVWATWITFLWPLALLMNLAYIAAIALGPRVEKM